MSLCCNPGGLLNGHRSVCYKASEAPGSTGGRTSAILGEERENKRLFELPSTGSGLKGSRKRTQEESACGTECGRASPEAAPASQTFDQECVTDNSPELNRHQVNQEQGTSHTGTRRDEATVRSREADETGPILPCRQRVASSGNQPPATGGISPAITPICHDTKLAAAYTGFPPPTLNSARRKAPHSNRAGIPGRPGRRAPEMSITQENAESGGARPESSARDAKLPSGFILRSWGSIADTGSSKTASSNIFPPGIAQKNLAGTRNHGKNSKQNHTNDSPDRDLRSRLHRIFSSRPVTEHRHPKKDTTPVTGMAKRQSPQTAIRRRGAIPMLRTATPVTDGSTAANSPGSQNGTAVRPGWMSEIIRRIQQNLRYPLRNRLAHKGIKLSYSNRELGQVDLSIRSRGNELSVELNVENHVLRKRIFAASRSLENELKNFGFESVDLDVKNRKEREQHRPRSQMLRGNADPENVKLAPHEEENAAIDQESISHGPPIHSLRFQSSQT